MIRQADKPSDIKVFLIYDTPVFLIFCKNSVLNRDFGDGGSIAFLIFNQIVVKCSISFFLLTKIISDLFIYEKEIN